MGEEDDRHAVERINTQIWTFHYGMAYPEE
jgi:hypothetical protein